METFLMYVRFLYCEAISEQQPSFPHSQVLVHKKNFFPLFRFLLLVQPKALHSDTVPRSYTMYMNASMSGMHCNSTCSKKGCWWDTWSKGVINYQAGIWICLLARSQSGGKCVSCMKFLVWCAYCCCTCSSSWLVKQPQHHFRPGTCSSAL